MCEHLESSTESLLIVDDDLFLREQLERAFQRRGYKVTTAGDGNLALAAIARMKYSKAVVDLRMPGLSGLAVLKAIREMSPTTEVVLLTGYGSIANAVEAMRLGARNYVAKPAHADEILAAFEALQHPLESAGDSPILPTLAEAEWEHIQRVLQEHQGNVTQAAHALGLSRRTLQRKLRKLAP